MAKPKLSGKTPDEADLNSLIGDHENLNAHPRGVRYAVIEYTVVDRTIHTSGDTVARVAVTHFEGLDDRNLTEEGRKLLDRGFKARTGKKNRPEPEPELDMSALEDADPSDLPRIGTPAE